MKLLPLLSRVRIRRTPTNANWSGDWPDTYVIVGARYDYRAAPPRVLYDLASDAEIARKDGYTDGFTDDDLELADVPHLTTSTPPPPLAPPCVPLVVLPNGKVIVG